MSESVVWLASYPKSGNTWVRAQLDALARGDGPDLRKLSAGSRVDATVGAALGDLGPGEAAALARLSWAMAATDGSVAAWRKTHHAWVEAADGFPLPWQPEGARAVYIIRDPRAVAVSWAHHLGVGLEVAVDIMGTDRRPDPFGPVRADVLTTWSEHVRSWTEDCSLPVLTVRYEDMCDQPEVELARLASFVGLDADAEQVRAAVAACAFDVLAAREIVEGFAEAAAADRAFFRRGQAQAWRDELPADLALRICDEHAEAMARFGYAD